MNKIPEIFLLSWDENFTTLKLNYRITNSLDISTNDFYFKVNKNSVIVEINVPYVKEKITFLVDNLYGNVINKSKKVIRKGELLTLSLVKEVKKKWGSLNYQVVNQETECNETASFEQSFTANVFANFDYKRNANETHYSPISNINDASDKSMSERMTNHCQSKNKSVSKSKNSNKSCVNSSKPPAKNSNKIDNVIGKYGHLPIFRKFGDNLT